MTLTKLCDFTFKIIIRTAPFRDHSCYCLSLKDCSSLFLIHHLEFCFKCFFLGSVTFWGFSSSEITFHNGKYRAVNRNEIFFVYFKQHSVYLTKEKVLLRAIRNHADKDTDRNTNFLFFFFLFFFVCIKYFQNSRTNFTFLGMRRRKGLDSGPCCSILYVNNEYCGYRVRQQAARQTKPPDWSEGLGGQCF